MDLPKIDFRHLLALTDETALLQHANFAIPNLEHGYCTDDNARALLALSMYVNLTGDNQYKPQLTKYLAFLKFAYNEDEGRFRNFMGFDRQWMEKVGSDDSHGRAIWALGVAYKLLPDSSHKLAGELMRKALPILRELPYPRTWAFAIIGCSAYLDRSPEDEEVDLMRYLLAERTLDAWQRNYTDSWPWPEDAVTYGNAKLPQALVISGTRLEREDMVEAGLHSLHWLINAQTATEGHLSIIGNDGWYPRDGVPAKFDQQPLEVHALVQACLGVARETGDLSWEEKAEWAFKWFLGENDVGKPIVDFESGGCCDGIGDGYVNENMGAESTLAYILSVLEFHRHAVRVRKLYPEKFADEENKE